MKRQICTRATTAAVFLGLVSVTAACGSSSDEKSAAEIQPCSTAKEASGDPVTIRIGRGLAAEEPLWLMADMPTIAPNQGKTYKIEMKRFDNVEQKMVAYQAGDLDAVSTTTAQLSLGVAVGAIDLTALFAIMNNGSATAFSDEYSVRPDSDIKEVADLKGKTISTNTPGAADQFSIRLMLKKAGLKPTDVEWNALPFPTQAQSLDKNVIDLATLVEPFASLAQQGPNPPRTLFTAHDATGYEYPWLVLGIDNEFAAKNLKAVCDFRDDYREAVAWYAAHVDEAKNRLSAGGYSLAPLDVYLKSRDYAYPTDGDISAKTLGKVLDDMVSVGSLKENQKAQVADLVSEGFTAGN